MIGTVIKIGWVSLWRNRVELLLTFIVPIAFFSIFAIIFGGQGGGGPTPRFSVVFVDLDETPTSKKFVETMAAESAFRVKGGAEGQEAWTLEQAEETVKKGKIDLAVVLEKGFASRVPAFTNKDVAARIISDGSNPMAPQVAFGLMQKCVMSGLQDRMLVGGAEQMSQAIGPLTGKQKTKLEALQKLLQDDQAKAKTEGPAQGGSSSSGFGGSPIQVKQVALISEKKKNSMVAYYAAAIAVMFLLFSLTGAGGTLLDEVENGTLERTLVSQLGMGRLLIGKWLFLTSLGLVQVVIMFLWGHFVFGGVDLFNHIPGFLAMTVMTTSAASGFGLVLASLCSSRAQLSGISTIVILSMSAMGGSMFPRFMMSETIQKVGSFTFNAWAVDGYQAVFWRDQGIGGIKLELAVLLGMTIGFGILARILARRWETQ
ncbi:MAG: ABC-2 type transport system permease protein [Planctomycetota bacterium]|jgi:ABC-2 type transport system permease protein